MLLKLTKRFIRGTDTRVLLKFMYNFGWKSVRSVQRFHQRIRRGEYFPAFLFISVTNRCNLRCQGCWVSATVPARELDLSTMNRLIGASKQQGSYFFGILGGEPLLHRGLFDLCKNHPDCYFLLFTNGTLLTETIAAQMRQLGNISPLISIEGKEQISDIRRGSASVYARTIAGLDHCRKHGLITGVATSVCKSNFADLVQQSFINELMQRGVHYLWYYIYRPVGPNPAPELVLSPEEILQLRRFMVTIRSKVPMLIVDSYWDHTGKAFCPAALGISHHISPGGDIEPCPPIQFAMENVNNGRSLSALFTESVFLKKFRELVTSTTSGCILMERPELLLQTMHEFDAIDSSGRQTAYAELARMKAYASHSMPGKEIPEDYWLYKLAKKYWFFGLGAYG